MASSAEMSGLARLMRPRTVAIVGATPEPGTIGGAVLANLERCSYQGNIHLVSRRSKEINGRPCVAAIDDLPDSIDAAVLPQQAVVDAVAACGRRGSVALSSSRRDSRRGRRRRSRRAGASGAGCAVACAILGPNCIGFTNFADGVALTFETIAPEPIAGRPAVGAVTQSGALAGALRIALSAKGLGVSHAVSTGNEADLTAEDFVAFLLDDPQTRAIALFLEQIRQPQMFLSLAARARSLRKPIILLHPGKSARARESASTHTGALAGDYAVMAALLRHAAVVLVDTIDELIDAADLLARATPPTGGAGIITNSGAIKGFALDFAETIDLDIPPPSPATRAALQAALPVFASPDNPVDVTAQVIKDLGIWTRAATALVADPGIGSLTHAGDAGRTNRRWTRSMRAPAILASGKPAVVAALGDESPSPGRVLHVVPRTAFRCFVRPSAPCRRWRCDHLQARPATRARRRRSARARRCRSGVLPICRQRPIWRARIPVPAESSRPTWPRPRRRARSAIRSRLRRRRARPHPQERCGGVILGRQRGARVAWGTMQGTAWRARASRSTAF
jgi:acyl-CoA synthetase (NDP forming)